MRSLARKSGRERVFVKGPDLLTEVFFGQDRPNLQARRAARFSSDSFRHDLWQEVMSRYSSLSPLWSKAKPSEGSSATIFLTLVYISRNLALSGPQRTKPSSQSDQLRSLPEVQTLEASMYCLSARNVRPDSFRKFPYSSARS